MCKTTPFSDNALGTFPYAQPVCAKRYFFSDIHGKDKI